MAIHTGSWGTPELGITEGVQKALSWLTGGDPRTAQGGSNLMPGGAPVTQLVNYSPPQTQTSSQLNYTPAPSVLGTTSTKTSYAAPTSLSEPTGDTGGGIDIGAQNDAITQEINSMYDQYTNSIASQGSMLDTQKTAQEQMAGNAYSQGINQQDLALQQGKDLLQGQRGDLVTNQNKNLRSLSDNLRNMYMAGNIYLGARGAGDSSAANQYSYALNKLGTQARGDQMSQTADLMSKVNAQEVNLKNTYDSNLKELQLNKDNQIQQISQWWSQQQQALQQAVASGQLAKGQALTQQSQLILQQAQQALQQVQTNAQNQYNSLLSWAETNSTTIADLKSKLGEAAQFAMTLPGASQVNGQISTDAQGNATMNPYIGGAGSTTTTKKYDQFGNLIK